MTPEPIPAQVLIEFAAGVALVRRHPRSAVTLRLSSDGSGVVRLELRTIEGVRLSAAVALAAASNHHEDGKA